MKPVTLLAIIGIAGVFVLSINTFDVFSADKINTVNNYSDGKSAQSIFITITNDQEQIAFNTFSRIGIVRGTNPQFLIESVPSHDNKKFLKFISENLEKNMRSRIETFDVTIDVLARDGTTIEKLKYWQCIADSYFVYSNDSKGTYSLLNQESSKAEIRDVIKFDCVSLNIEV